MARRGDTTEYAELISLLEHVLSPATDDMVQPQPPAATASPGSERGATATSSAPAYDQATSPAPRDSAPPSISPSIGITGLLADAMPIGIAILEAATLRVLRTNVVLLHMTGSDERPESAVGKRIDAVAPLLAAPAIVAALQRAASTKRDYIDMLADAGTGRRPAYLRCCLSPMGRGEGAQDTVLLTLQDVSDQVRLRQRAEQGAGLTEEQVNARVQDALRRHEGRVRELEGQLRGALEEKRRLEETTREAAEAARMQYAQLAQAQSELGRLRSGGAAPAAAATTAAATTAATDGRERAMLAVAAALAASTATPRALAGAAQAVAEALGDSCAIFLRDADDKITPVAIYHRDQLLAAHLRAHYVAHPVRLRQGPIGRAAYDGERTLRASLAPPELDELLGGNSELGAALSALAAACVPLPGAGEPLGALLLLSTARARGGSERRLDGGTVATLGEAAGLVALAARNARLRTDLAALEAQHQALLQGTPDGVALYDRLGRLRQTNLAAERLLMPPHGGRALLQGFLSPDGQPLSTEALPWMRALHGEMVGATAPERLVAVWEGNLQRVLLVRALPVRTGQGSPEEAIAYALVLLRTAGTAEWFDSAPPPGRLEASGSARASATAGYVDLVDTCARVARTQGAALQRRLELRLPSRAVPVALPEAEIERLLSALLATAAQAFPSGVALRVRMVLDPAELATLLRAGGSGGAIGRAAASSPSFPSPASASAPQSGARPGGGSGIRADAMAAVQVTGPRSDARTESAKEALAGLQALAQSLGGAAWVFDDRSHEVSYLVRLPIAAP